MDFALIVKDSWKKFIDDIINLILFVLLGSVLCMTVILIPTVMGGFTRGFLGYVREGKKPEFNELWNFSGFLQILLLFIVGGFLVGIGYCLLIIPGIVLTIWWMYALFFIVDKDMGFWEAMSASRNAVGKHGLINNFVIILIVSVLNSIGSALFGLGALVTAPLGMIIMTMAYIESTE